MKNVEPTFALKADKQHSLLMYRCCIQPPNNHADRNSESNNNYTHAHKTPQPNIRFLSIWANMWPAFVWKLPATCSCFGILLLDSHKIKPPCLRYDCGTVASSEPSCPGCSHLGCLNQLWTRATLVMSRSGCLSWLQTLTDNWSDAQSEREVERDASFRHTDCCFAVSGQTSSAIIITMLQTYLGRSWFFPLRNQA